jgi:phage shock protein PspC (stress-responsive transcriptional regulator)
METKKLYRSNTDKMIAGVCGGLGKFFDIDTTIVRILFVFLLLTGSAGFWIYLIMMLFVPMETRSSDEVVDLSPSVEDEDLGE